MSKLKTNKTLHSRQRLAGFTPTPKTFGSGGLPPTTNALVWGFTLRRTRLRRNLAASAVRTWFHQNLVSVKGFTLIELLVVISLIGVLTTLVLANLNAARERGRDAQRKADMRNIQTAIRLYYNDQGGYPSSVTGQILGCGSGGSSACIWDAEWSVGTMVYMSTLPTDPLPNVDYFYDQTDPDNYTLSACLENTSDDKGVTDPTATWCPTQYVYRVKP